MTPPKVFINGEEWVRKECPCLSGFPHVCKDGEDLLNDATCPCKCHKTLTETHVIKPKECGSQCPLIGVTVKNGRRVGVCAMHGVQEPKPECEHQWNYGNIFAWAFDLESLRKKFL